MNNFYSIFVTYIDEKKMEAPMRNFISLLLVMLIGLQCRAADIYPLSNMPAKTIDGSVRNCGNRDVIMLNSKTDFLDTMFGNGTTNATIAGATAAGLAMATLALSDPYYIQVDGKNYVMIKDKTTNNWSADDFLGIEDTKATLFNGLRSLESDGDRRKITSNELKKAKIRFARVNPDGTVLANDRTKDLDLNRIDYIDMTNLRRVANSEVKGIAGHFNVYLKTNNNTKRMVIGYATLDNKDNLQIIFK